MRHDKIIKDERGKIRIAVDLYVFERWAKDANGNEYRYDVTVWHTEPKKRTERVVFHAATPEEIQQAKTELWNKFKP